MRGKTEILPQILLGEPIQPMTNKEAAEIIRTVFNSMVYPRACVKSRLIMKRYEAFMKAITLLENTPD